jgi:alanyl-tRNA synthetase
LIRDDFLVQTDVMAYQEAMTSGALALFTEKYGDQVRVVTMGPSRELCGGTHVHRTGEIGVFFILSESSVSAGIRRLECVASEAAYCYARGQIDELRSLARELEAPQGQVVARARTLRAGLRALERQLNEARQEIANLKVQSLIGGSGQGDSGAPETADGFTILVQHTRADSLDDLKSQSDALKGRLAPCVVVLGAEVKGHAMFTAAATRGLEAKGISAGDLVRAAAQAAGGKGGGSPTWAQGSAPDPGKIDAGLEAAHALLSQWLVVSD